MTFEEACQKCKNNYITLGESLWRREYRMTTKDAYYGHYRAVYDGSTEDCLNDFDAMGFCERVR